MNNNSLAEEARDVLLQLVDCINQLNFDEYTKKNNLLSNGTIGDHTRHIIELFEQLLSGYDTENINYDTRKRDIRIQENIDFATESIANIITRLDRNDKQLILTTLYFNQEMNIDTTYYRELMYNIEHCIHHQAIIKIALLYFGKTEIIENFGIAKSTIEYKKQCAQ